MIFDHDIKRYVPYALLAAVLYSVPVFVYLYRSSYTESWILYLGNFLFGIAIALFIAAFYRQHKQTRSISKMAMAAHMTSVMGIISSLVICFVLLLILKPEVLFGHRQGVTELTKVAAQSAPQKNDDLLMILLVDAIIGNAATGFFMAIMLPFAIMRNQKGNKEGENLGPGMPVQKTGRTYINSMDEPVRLPERK